MTTLSAAEALRRQLAPQRVIERRPAGDADVALGALTLNRQSLKARIEQAVIGASLERTIDGASTLTLNLLDTEGALLAEGFVNERSDLVLDGLGYTLVRVASPGAARLDLTFEDREVSLLRRYTEPRKVARGVMTRAEFALSLVREVRERRIGFYSPSLHDRQPIESSADAVGVEEARDATLQPGLERNAALAIGGTAADAEQLANVQRVLDTARSVGASERATLALIEACLVESSFRNLTGGDSSSVGILQLLNTHLGGSSATRGGRRDVELVTRLFLTQGFTGRGGAISLAARNPQWTPGQVAQAVQGSRFPDRYEQRRAEADAILDAYAGGGSFSASVQASAGGVYEFARGQLGADPTQPPESSWDALVRLAQEVGWRCFVVAGVVYFISDPDLMASRPRMRLGRTSDGVDDISFEWDTGQPAAEATVYARAERWAAPPGTVVVLERCGPASGRWLVSRITRNSLFDQATEILLTRATEPLPEPAGDTTTVDLASGPDVALALDTGAAGASTLVTLATALTQGGRSVQVQARFAQIVEAIVDRFDVLVSSGYRSSEHNTEVGGAARSDHLCGAAADFVGPMEAMVSVRRWASTQGFAYVDGPDVNRDGKHGDHTHISFVRCGVA